MVEFVVRLLEKRHIYGINGDFSQKDIIYERVSLDNDSIFLFVSENFKKQILLENIKSQTILIDNVWLSYFSVFQIAFRISC